MELAVLKKALKPWHVIDTANSAMIRPGLRIASTDLRLGIWRHCSALRLLGSIYGRTPDGPIRSATLVVVAFGVIFVIYMFLPIIQAMALTIVVPLTLILRSVPFAGPRLREAADSIMGLAIGFYFILPLVLILNQYIITWLYTPCIIQTSLNGIASTHPQFLLCNPYYGFTGSYKLINIPVDSFFTSSPSSLASGVQSVGIAGLANGATTSFFSGAISGAGGAGPLIQKIFSSLFGLPQVIIAYAQEVSQYLFEGIVLIGIDMAITIGFAQGLSKGFGSVSRIIGSGPFWGNI